MHLARTTSIATAIAVFSSVGIVHANPGITGYSGKPYNGATDVCNTACHVANPSAPPTITVTIPSTVTAGSTSDVTVVVAGSKARTSMNAAFSDGVVATKGQNTDIPFPMQAPGEVGAVDPPPNGATGTFKFSFKAPATNGTITMWIAAMSASGAGTAGDGVAKTTRTITVTGGSTTSSSGTSGTTSSSGTSGTTSSSGTSGTSGTTSSSGTSGTTSGDGTTSGAPSSSSGGRPTAPSDDGGCSTSSAPPSVSSLLVVLALVALRLRGSAADRSSHRRRLDRRDGQLPR